LLITGYLIDVYDIDDFEFFFEAGRTPDQLLWW